MIPNFITALIAAATAGDLRRRRAVARLHLRRQRRRRRTCWRSNAPGIAGKVYNVACGERVTLNRLVSELRDLLGIGRRAGVRRPARRRHQAFARRSLARARRARIRADVRLREGLERTIGHLRERGRRGD